MFLKTKIADFVLGSQANKLLQNPSMVSLKTDL